MPPASAPFLTKRLVATVIDNEVVDTRQPPWQPILANASLAIKPPPPPTEEEVAAWRTKQNELAAQAQTRYETWLGDYPPPKPIDLIRDRPATSSHPTHHKFRERRKEMELAPKHWSNPDRVAHERERIEEVLKSSLYMVHPPYPKAGGGMKNREFSYMGSSYDYRQRQPSKEIAGTCSFMRTKPRTESERINLSLQVRRLCTPPMRTRCPPTRGHTSRGPSAPPSPSTLPSPPRSLPRSPLAHLLLNGIAGGLAPRHNVRRPMDIRPEVRQSAALHAGHVREPLPLGLAAEMDARGAWRLRDELPARHRRLAARVHPPR